MSNKSIFSNLFDWVLGLLLGLVWNKTINSFFFFCKLNFTLNEKYKYILLTHLKYVAENKMHFCDGAFENTGKAKTNLNWFIDNLPEPTVEYVTWMAGVKTKALRNNKRPLLCDIISNNPNN